MSERCQVFKCDSCGDMVEIVHTSKCEPSCCGQPMRLVVENTTDAAKEKHVPVIERLAEGIKVSVGSVAHPMEAEHYIEWIEVLVRGPDGSVKASYRKFLAPGEKPEAVFPVKDAQVTVREYCNKHGLWKA